MAFHPREGRRVFAIKGVGGEGRALVGRPSKNNVGKVRLFPVGVDTAKELIYARSKIKEPGVEKVRARNEALDCRVYALAAYALLNANINQIANRIAMKSEAVEPKTEAVSPARRIRRPRKQNWVNGWR